MLTYPFCWGHNSEFLPWDGSFPVEVCVKRQGLWELLWWVCFLHGVENTTFNESHLCCRNSDATTNSPDVHRPNTAYLVRFPAPNDEFRSSWQNLFWIHILKEQKLLKHSLIPEKPEKPPYGDLALKVLLLFKGFLMLKFWCLLSCFEQRENVELCGCQKIMTRIVHDEGNFRDITSLTVWIVLV